jgi:hypothetical protein
MAEHRSLIGVPSRMQVGTHPEGMLTWTFARRDPASRRARPD